MILISRRLFAGRPPRLIMDAMVSVSFVNSDLVSLASSDRRGL